MKKSFGTLLRLRPIEWMPIVAAVLINVITGLYVMSGMTARMEAARKTPYDFSQNTATRAPDFPSRLFEAGKIPTVGLLLLGCGCWMWRANQWIRQSE